MMRAMIGDTSSSRANCVTAGSGVLSMSSHFKFMITPNPDGYLTSFLN
jgi:hypothetical protein